MKSLLSNARTNLEKTQFSIVRALIRRLVIVCLLCMLLILMLTTMWSNQVSKWTSTQSSSSTTKASKLRNRKCKSKAAINLWVTKSAIACKLFKAVKVTRNVWSITNPKSAIKFKPSSSKSFKYNSKFNSWGRRRPKHKFNWVKIYCLNRLVSDRSRPSWWIRAKRWNHSRVEALLINEIKN